MHRDQKFQFFKVIGLSAVMALGAACAGEDGSEVGTGPELGEQAPDGDAVGVSKPGEQYDDIGDPRHPELLVAGEPTARSMRMVGDRLYWVEDGGPVFFLSWVRPGGGPVFVTAKMEDYPYSLAIDEGSAYWSVPEKGRLYRVGLEGGDSEILWDDSDNVPLAVTVDETELYFTTADGCVRSVNLKSADLAEVTCADGTPTSMALHKSDVWWSIAEGGLFRADKFGGEATKWVSGESFDSEIIVDDSQVYWLNAQSRSVLGVGTETPGSIRALAKFQYAPTGITQDRFYIYFTTQSDDSVKRVYKGGSPPHVIADSQPYPGDVARHNDRLYWVNEGEGTIMTIDLR